MNNILQYIIIALLILGSYIIFLFFRRKASNKKIREKLIMNWGKESEERYSSDELQSISSYYINRREDKKDIHYIDDITWNDTDMDRVYARINNTCSTIGDEYLYYLLREPVFEDEILKKRNKLTEFFQKNSEYRLKLQIILSRLGKSKYLNITDYFYSDMNDTKIKSIYYKILAGILLLSPLIIIFNVKLAVCMVLISTITNMLVYYIVKRKIAVYLGSLSYIVDMVSCAKQVCKSDIKEIDEYRDILQDSLIEVRHVINKSFWLFYTTENPLVEYVRIMLLGELITFEGIFKFIEKYSLNFKKIYETLGTLDSMLSIASYRDSLKYYTIPIMDSLWNGKKSIEITDVYHPLIKDPVSNSFFTEKAVLFTGSNASGKSTFLKTIAINAIFAQTIFTSLSKKYVSCYFKIYTSMALKDSLKNNESYYIAEIKALKRIFDSLTDLTPSLCLLDEVLRGTNTVERIAASSEILFHLSKNNCICIAATHDLELASILKFSYDNYHFQEEIIDNEIVFDYKIYSGKTSSRNAIKLLKLIGYSEEIIKSAEERATSFLNHREWKEIKSTEFIPDA